MKTLSILLKIIVALLIAVVLNKILLPQNMGFITIHPHPYWIAVLFFSLSFSTTPAIGAAACFSVLYALLFYISPFCIDKEHLFEFENVLTILSFPFAAFIISSVNTQKQQRIVCLKNDQKKLLNQIDEMGKVLKFNEDLYIQLEKKIMNQPVTVSQAFEITRTLENADTTTIMNEILAIIHFYAQVKKSIAFEVKEDCLFPVAYKGWKEASYPDYTTNKPSLIRQCFEKKQVVWVGERSWEDEAFGSNTPLCCGPVTVQDNSLYAIICIIDIPFVSFNQQTFDFFSILLERASQIIIQKNDRERSKGNEMFDPQTGINNFSYMKKIFQRELDLCKRFNRFLSIVTVKFFCHKTLNHYRIRLLIFNLIATILPSQDNISSYKGNDSFFILLPDTTEQEAHCFAQKVKKRISAFYNDFVTNNLLDIQCGVATVDNSKHHRKLFTQKV